MPAEIKQVLDPYLNTLEHRLETEGNLPEDEAPSESAGDAWSDDERGSDDPGPAIGRSNSRRGDSWEDDSEPDAAGGLESLAEAVEERLLGRALSNSLPRWADR